MTTPRVIELRRTLAATSRDTFAGSDGEADGPLAVVLPLRPRDPAALRHTPRSRRGAPGSVHGSDPGGGCAA